MKALNLFYYLLAITFFFGLGSCKDKNPDVVTHSFSYPVDLIIKNSSSYEVTVTFSDVVTGRVIGRYSLNSGSLSTLNDVLWSSGLFSYSVVCSYNFFSDISGGTQISSVAFTDDRAVSHKVTDFGYRTINGEKVYLYSGSLSLDGDYPYNDINCVIR